LRVFDTLVYFAGIPLACELDKDLQPTKHYSLATEDQVKAAEAKVAAQGKDK
jgi:2,3-bisphosphoglycerate-dependent phosphoglycerate mutase